MPQKAQSDPSENGRLKAGSEVESVRILVLGRNQNKRIEQVIASSSAAGKINGALARVSTGRVG